MKQVRYVCAHCGRHFEAEEQENIECPGCFWSTSVKREEDLPTAAVEHKILEEIPKAPFSWEPLYLFGAALKNFFAKFGWIFLGIFVLIIIGSGIVSFWPKIQKNISQIPAVIKISPVDKMPSEKTKESSAVPQGMIAPSPQETEILSRRLQVSADRIPDEAENKILNLHASFQTGYAVKLPSQIWTLQQFKEMLAGQEQNYKMPLPGSYRKKLLNLFQTKYLASQQPFEADNLLAARDLWIEALEFPIYANDIKKHRGVILTMLRPYINDTLAKIGVANRALSEKVVRDREFEVSQVYQSLLAAIASKSWPEALAKAESMEKQIRDLENMAKRPNPAPPYQQSAIPLVDEGIRAALMDLLAPGPVEMADLSALRQDILAKKNVIRSFIQSAVDEVQGHYDSALTLINQQDWDGAEKELREVQMPAVLANDAQEKIRILEKLKQQIPPTPSELAGIHPDQQKE